MRCIDTGRRDTASSLSATNHCSVMHHCAAGDALCCPDSRILPLLHNSCMLGYGDVAARFTTRPFTPPDVAAARRRAAATRQAVAYHRPDAHLSQPSTIFGRMASPLCILCRTPGHHVGALAALRREFMQPGRGQMKTSRTTTWTDEVGPQAFDRASPSR
jgi:hypothetical protein